MKTLTYNQLKRIVLEARKSADDEFTVPDENIIDLDTVQKGTPEELKALIESLDKAGSNLEDIDKLHKELKKITIDALHDRANAKNEVGVAKAHERKTDFADKALKTFVDKAGEFEHGDRVFFKLEDDVDGLKEDIGIVLQSKKAPYSDVKKYGALMKLFEDEGVIESNPMFATLGAGLKATLESTVAAARKAGFDIPDEETTWTASMYTRDRGTGKFNRVNEGFGEFASNAWGKVKNAWESFKNWFVDKFLPKYDREVTEFRQEAQECQKVITRARRAIREKFSDYDLPPMSAMLQEGRRFNRRPGRSISRR